MSSSLQKKKQNFLLQPFLHHGSQHNQITTNLFMENKLNRVVCIVKAISCTDFKSNVHFNFSLLKPTSKDIGIFTQLWVKVATL